MHILISPNAFKNSLEAGSVALAIEKGLQQSSLSCTTEIFPIGDGGDGTGYLLTQKLGGTIIHKTVQDPLGRNREASFGYMEDSQTAVIEMASASGLRLLQETELDPLHASSYGTGELVLKALDKGAKKIILCVGGTATIDGGTGILKALGIHFLDKNGNALNGMPESLVNLDSINMSGLDKRILKCECIILCDVANTLLGENGAANIFGPQKGAAEKDVIQLEASLTQFNKIVLQTLGMNMASLIHGGAAGGTAAGLHACIDAKLVNGIDYFLEIAGFDEALQKADILITGEGSIDLQTLEGKAPYGAAVRAKKKNIRVIALAGKIPLQNYPELDAYFDVLLTINNEPTDMQAALLATNDNLTRCAKQLGNLLAIETND